MSILKNIAYDKPTCQLLHYGKLHEGVTPGTPLTIFTTTVDHIYFYEVYEMLRYYLVGLKICPTKQFTIVGKLKSSDFG